MFQMTFAIITVALISGAVADRMKFARLAASSCPSGRCSSTSRWRTWSSAAPRTRSSAAGSAPRTTPAARRCTSTPVSPAWSSSSLLGKRIGFGKEAIRPHNLTLTMLGAGLLWFGWYGFNVGSIVFAGATDGPRAVLRRDRPDLRQHHAGHDGRDPRLAADRVPAAQEGHLARRRVRHRRGSGRDHPGCRRGQPRRGGRHRRHRRRGLRLRRRAEVQARLRRLARRRRRPPRRRHHRHPR